jgi:hypothetical protein
MDIGAMLRHAELALGMALATAIWTVVLALQSDASATYQICETNQYTGQEHCSPHHLLYVLFWYGGYVFNAATITAAATVAIAIFTWTLYVINRDQLLHNRRVERAYIKMSSLVPPGVVFGPEGRIEVTIEVRNHGITPGRVTDLVGTANTCPLDQNMPPVPNYARSPAIAPTAFLVANDFVATTSWLTLAKDQAEQAQRGECKLFVFGLVDYVDQFDQRHRSGFGRRYVRGQTGNNLVFMEEAGYNYDRVRRPGEGNDWNR